ncbi:MAG: malonyl-ACP O-methyltransferase BioC [Bacteroidota bacterium]
MNIPDKELIGKRFFKKKDTYKKQAVIQQKVSNMLAEMIHAHSDSYTKMLEIGCGVGFLTDFILSKCSVEKFFANDITGHLEDELLQIIKSHSCPSSEFIWGDAEEITFPPHLSAVVSSSTFQWFHDIPSFIVKTYNTLEKDGLFAFSTYGPNNFIEIKKINNYGLRYLTLAQLKALLKPYFEIISAEEWTEKLYFKDPYDVLKHIQATGVNSITNHQSYFGKKNIEQFIRSYNRFFTEDDKVFITYHPIIILAKKK